MKQLENTAVIVGCISIFESSPNFVLKRKIVAHVVPFVWLIDEEPFIIFWLAGYDEVQEINQYSYSLIMSNLTTSP